MTRRRGVAKKGSTQPFRLGLHISEGHPWSHVVSPHYCNCMHFLFIIYNFHFKRSVVPERSKNGHRMGVTVVTSGHLIDAEKYKEDVKCPDLCWMFELRGWWPDSPLVCDSKHNTTRHRRPQSCVYLSFLVFGTSLFSPVRCNDILIKEILCGILRVAWTWDCL